MKIVFEEVAKLRFGPRSALSLSDSDSSQFAYAILDMSICEEHEPIAKSSNLGSKANFTTPSLPRNYLLALPSAFKLIEYKNIDFFF